MGSIRRLIGLLLAVTHVRCNLVFEAKYSAFRRSRRTEIQPILPSVIEHRMYWSNY